MLLSVTPLLAQGLGAREPGSTQAVGGSDLGLTAPRLVYKVEPDYAEQARAARLQGTVILDVDVSPEGLAVNPRVVQSLGLGLDDKAIEAVRKWKFVPGYRYGKPVTVAARIQVNFRLQDDPPRQSPGTLAWKDVCTPGPFWCGHRIIPLVSAASALAKDLGDENVTLEVRLAPEKSKIRAYVSVWATKRAVDVFASRARLHISAPTPESDILATDPQKLVRSVQRTALWRSIGASMAARRTTTATVTDSNGRSHDVTVQTRDTSGVDDIQRQADEEAATFLRDQTVGPGGSANGWIEFETPKQVAATTMNITIGLTTFQIPFVIDAKTRVAR